MEFLIYYLIWILIGAYGMYRFAKYGDLSDKKYFNGVDIFFITFMIFFGGVCGFLLLLFCGDLKFKFKNYDLRIKNPFYKNKE